MRAWESQSFMSGARLRGESVPMLKDMVGLTFGMLTVVERAGSKGRKSLWLCRCACGSATTAEAYDLTSGRKKSCGCRKNAAPRPAKNIRDMTGLRFGKWTVVERAGYKHGDVAWLCRCECGTERTHAGQNLRRGRTNSCGCAQQQPRVVHGHARKGVVSSTYVTWQAMVKRCEYPGRWNFKYWGGRGVTVCERWRRGDGKRSGFELFYADMGPKPFGLSLDRIDNDLGYGPSNGRWTTRIGQARNRRPRQRAPYLAA